MIPVRKLERSAARRLAASASSAMNMVGTPYSAVQRSCGNCPERGFRIEALRGQHDGRSMRDAVEHTHDHAEAVISGTGQTQRSLGEPQLRRP